MVANPRKRREVKKSQITDLSQLGMTPEEFRADEDYYDPILNEEEDEEEISNINKTSTLTIRLTDHEKEVIAEKAKKLGVSKSDIIRIYLKKSHLFDEKDII